MPCSSCTLHETKFSESSNGKDYVWLCCYCKSSLNSGRFDSSCTNCGHEGPTYGALTCPGSDLMAISVHQVETQQPEPLFPTATSKLSFLPYDPKSRPPYDTKDKFLDPKISPTRDTALSPSPHENPPKPLHVDDTISATPTEASSVTSTVSKLETDEEIEYNSSTDYSDTESAHDCMLERYVQDGAQSLVERLTKNLRFEFDPESAIIRCTAGQKNGSSSSSSHPPSSHADLTIKQSPDRRARIRKRENEEDDSEGENEKIPSKRRKGKSKVESLPLACPFFKRNPRLCTRYRSCSEKGWTQFYRLKEHIARCHRVYQCPRCHLGFLQEEKLVAHYSSPDCFPRDEIRIFGINDKMFQLVVYGRLKGRTPDEKWKELYSKIFPEVPQESLPSPYFDGKALETVDDGYYCAILDREELCKRICEDVQNQTISLLRETYRKDLKIACHGDCEKLRALKSTTDFETKLRDCMKLAVMQVCPPFLWAHLATGPLAESNNIYSSTTSANLRQDEYLADIETFVSGEADIGSSANISSAFYHPSNLGTEVDLGDEFPIEEAFQGCNWDNLECSVADLAWKNDIEEKAPQPMTNAITDNLTLEFPEPFDQSAISMLQLHFPVPTLTKQDLGFSSLEIAAADVLDKQIPSEMNTAHETGVGLSHQHDNSPSCRRRDYG